MTVIEAKVDASTDDAFDSLDSFPGDSAAGNTIFWGATAATETMYTGARWSGLGIPAGATFNSATMTVYRLVFNSDGNEFVTFHLQVDSAAATFTPGSDSPFDRFGSATFTSSNSWTMGADGGDTDSETTPDFAAALSSVSTAVGAIDGLVLVGIGEGSSTDAQCEAYAYDLDSALSAFLEIDYTPGAGGAAPVFRNFMTMGVGR